VHLKPAAAYAHVRQHTHRGNMLSYRIFFIGWVCVSFFIETFSQTLAESHYIDKRVEAFSTRLSFFPPAVKDSNDTHILSQQLTAFLDTLQGMRRDGKIRNDEKYYLWMAQLYYFAHNLDIPNALDNSDSFYEIALSANPSSSQARIGLAGNYSQRWNPSDTNSYGYLDKGFSLLHELYREGGDSLNPALYSSMFFYGLCFHSKAICFDSWVKLKKYCPKRDIESEEGLMSSLSDSSISLELSDSQIIYQNKIARFKVAYPDNFVLYREISSGSHDGAMVLMVETPLTERVRYGPLRNSISIIATPTHSTSEYDLIHNFLKRGKLTQDSVRSLPNNKCRSLYFSSHARIPDEYRGIVTIIKNADYYYQIVYSATYLTYEKNLKYFFDFEASLNYQ